MTDRRSFVSGLALGLLAAPLVAETQQVGKVYRLGILTPRGPDPPAIQSTPNSVPLALRELGYVEGQNLVIERRFAEGKLDRLPGLARELVRLRMDVILGNSTGAIAAARDATRTIPIVMSFTDDPVAAGFVASLARPGGNITGVTLGDAALAGKRVEIIKEAVPRASRIAFLTTGRGTGGWDRQVDEAQQVAGSLGVKLIVVEVRDGDYDRAFAMMVVERASALHVSGPVHFGHQARTRIRELAAKHRLPTIYEWRQAVEEGGLMSYGPKFSALFRRVAAFIDRILRGANPAELPVELPTVFELLINLRTAKSLGLTFPPSIMIQASEVIE